MLTPPNDGSQKTQQTDIQLSDNQERKCAGA